MEVQFEVHSCLENKHYVQWYKHILRKRIWWCGLAALWTVFYLAKGIASVDWIRIIFAAYCAGYCIWNYCRPWILAKKIRKRDLAYYGTELVPSVTTFADVLRDVAKDMDVTIPYDKIKEIHISNDLIALTDIKDSVILMDKNGFTKGDFLGLLAFLAEKCPQLKLPKY